MGEARIKKTATMRLLERFPLCCFCAGKRQATTREHMPPKSLFDNSFRPDKLVMPACTECNRFTSTADLTAAIISRWNYDSGDQERLDTKKLNRQVRRQCPDLIDEWVMSSAVQRKKGRQHLVKHGVPVPSDAGIVNIGVKTIQQLNIFAHKAVLALYFEHFRKPLLHDGRLYALWKTKEDFARDGIPPVLSDILPKYAAIAQGCWNEAETFEYRHAVNEADGLLGCLAKLRKGLFVGGFAATNVATLESEIENWLPPDELQVMAQLPRFRKKL